MKRLVSLALALVLALSMCAFSLPAVAEDSKELIVWAYGNTAQVDRDLVLDRFDEVLQKYLPGVTTSFRYVDSLPDYANRALAAEERIDLLWIGWSHDWNQMALDGNILPLDDLLAEYGQSIVDVIGMNVLDLHRQTDGKIYLIPNGGGTTQYGGAVFLKDEVVQLLPEGWMENAQQLAYDLFDADPLTASAVELQNAFYDQLAIYFRTARDNGMLGAGIDANTGFGYAGFDRGNLEGVGAGSIFISRYDDTFTCYNLYTGDMMKNHYRRMAEWYDEGLIKSDILSNPGSNDWSDGWQDIDYGSRGHLVDTGDYAAYLTEAYAFPIDVIYAQKYVRNEKNNNGYCVPFTAGEPELAIQLLDLMYSSQELWNLYMYGIEGVHYTAQEDGTVLLNGDSTGNGTGNATDDWKYGQVSWTIGNTLLTYRTQQPGTDTTQTAQRMEDAKVGFSSPLIRFVFDSTNVSAELTALNTITEEYSWELLYGTRGVDGWEDYFNEYVDKLNASGYEDLLAEVQAQVDAYIEANGITSWNMLRNSEVTVDIH